MTPRLSPAQLVLSFLAHHSSPLIAAAAPLPRPTPSFKAPPSLPPASHHSPVPRVPQMGLSSLPSAADAFFPFALVAYALIPIAMLLDAVRRAVVWIISYGDDVEVGEEEEGIGDLRGVLSSGKSARVEAKRFGLMRPGGGADADGECCVCLRAFGDGEVVSQLVACRHFFHRECLMRWLAHFHLTCPLCRSLVCN